MTVLSLTGGKQVRSPPCAAVSRHHAGVSVLACAVTMEGGTGRHGPCVRRTASRPEVGNRALPSDTLLGTQSERKSAALLND
jgi:hypothetical protein